MAESNIIGQTVGNVLYPVADVLAAADFYDRSFGFRAKFVDGERYAALDGGGITFAVVGPDETLTPVPAVSIKVTSVATVLDKVVAAGGSIVREPEQGPHEIRAVARDPWGNSLIVYGPGL